MDRKVQIPTAAAITTRISRIVPKDMPRLLFESWLQQAPNALDHMLLDYEVPLRGGRRLNLKAVNWPKTLCLAHGKDVKRARDHLFSLFASLPISTMSLIRFRGHLPEGGYDGQNGIRQVGATAPPAVH